MPASEAFRVLQIAVKSPVRGATTIATLFADHFETLATELRFNDENRHRTRVMLPRLDDTEAAPVLAQHLEWLKAVERSEKASGSRAKAEAAARACAEGARWAGMGWELPASSAFDACGDRTIGVLTFALPDGTSVQVSRKRLAAFKTAAKRMRARIFVTASGLLVSWRDFRGGFMPAEPSNDEMRWSDHLTIALQFDA